jgi:hypothetical protein
MCTIALLDPEHEGTKIFQNFCNYLPSGMTSDSTMIESSVEILMMYNQIMEDEMGRACNKHGK